MQGRGKVLVVGDNDLAGLATVRSLGRAGLRVSLVSFEDCPAARWSRHVARVHRLGHPLGQPRAFAQAVLDLARRERFDLVMPTSDKGLLPLLPLRQEIEACSRLAAPSDEALDAACRKEATVALAQRLGVPVPPTRVLRDGSPLPRFDSFPVVLKPSRSVVPGTAGRHEVAIARAPDDIARLLPAMLKSGPVLAQGFVGGRGVGLNVLADGGEVVAAFQHRRIHEPHAGGASSYRASEPLCPVLLGHARKMMAALRWTGPAMLEFKDCPVAGPSLMEINGRLWGSVALAIAAGIDFPRLAYELFVHGRAAPVFDYRVPFYVRHTIKDLFWLRQNLAAPAGSLGLSWRQILGEAWNVLRLREGYDLEWLSDPLPALAAWGHLAAGLAGKAWGRFRRWRLGSRLGRQQAGPLLREARSALVVCTGNINRSAVAARLLAEAAPWLEVRSAGTLGREGVPSSPVSVEAAAQVGADIGGHRSSALSKEALRRADVVLAMDLGHAEAIARLCPSALRRTLLLGALDGEGLEIADPDGHGPEAYRAAYRRIRRCVEQLLSGFAQTPGPSRAGQPIPCLKPSG